MDLGSEEYAGNKDDRYAAEEVARQLHAATQTLEKRVQHYVGLSSRPRTGCR